MRYWALQSEHIKGGAHGHKTGPDLENIIDQNQSVYEVRTETQKSPGSVFWS